MAKTFDEAARAKATEIGELVISKQRDYGKGNILNTPFSPQLVIAVRLNEKIARLANLLQSGKQPSNESLKDTWEDIIGYAFCGIMVEEGTFELEVEQ